MHWFGYIDFTMFLQIYLFGYLLKFGILLFIQIINRRFYFSFSFKDLQLKEMLSYGLYVLIGSFSTILVTRIDMMMIGSLLDLKQVAFYTVAFFMGNAIMVPAKSIAAISIPLIAKSLAEKDLQNIQLLYKKSAINQLIIGGVFFLCIWINIDEVFSLLPEKFHAGKWVVFYIGFAQLFNIATGLSGEIIINSEYYRYSLYTSVFLVFVTIATNFFFIQKYQTIEGAAIATALSILLFNFIRLIVLKVKLNIQPFSLKTIYTSFLLFGIYFLLTYLLPIFGYAILDIIWRSMVVFIIFLPLVLYFNLSDDISEIFHELKTKIFRSNNS